MQEDNNLILPDHVVLVPDNAREVFKGELFSVHHWEQELYDGTTATFEMLKRCHGAHGFCVVEDKIIVLRDTQPNRGEVWSLPGGQIDEGETPLQAFKREALEETGYQFANIKLIRVHQPDQKIESFHYIFTASNGKKVAEPKIDPGEKIEINFWSLEQLKRESPTSLHLNPITIAKFETIDQLLAAPDLLDS